MVKSASASPPPRLRRPPPIDSRSGDRFKGVRRRNWGRWVSEIRIPHSRDKIWLGSYATAEQAARAYDIASLLLRGPSCSGFLNFPDSSSLVLSAHPQLASLAAAGMPPSPHTIQVTAAAAANASSPPTTHTTDVRALPDAAELNDSSDTVSSDTRDCCTTASTIHSCWIHDVLALIRSPKDKTSPPSLSPSIAKCSVATSPKPPVAMAANGHGSMQCSFRTSSPEYFLHTLFDDFQYPLEGLARDGFTAISAAVTTQKPFDTETAGSSCEVDATQLWSYVS